MRKPTLKKISTLIILSLILTCFMELPQKTFAATMDSQIKKLVGKMNVYESTVVTGKTKTIKLTKKKMAKAAALSIKVSEKDGISKSQFGSYDTYKITNKKLQKASQNLFGIKLSGENLPSKTQTENTYDAYKKPDGSLVVFLFDGETENDYVVHDIDIKKTSKNTYQVKKNIYYGYWGMNNGQSNYTIEYQVKNSAKSEYGCKITKMKVFYLN